LKAKRKGIDQKLVFSIAKPNIIFGIIYKIRSLKTLAWPRQANWEVDIYNITQTLTIYSL